MVCDCQVVLKNLIEVKARVKSDEKLGMSIMEIAKVGGWDNRGRTPGLPYRSSLVG